VMCKLAVKRVALANVCSKINCAIK